MNSTEKRLMIQAPAKLADKLWGELMHRMYRECAVCGGRNQLQAHHLITRSRKSLRHAPELGILLCVDCHEHDTECSPHAAPHAFKIWHEQTHPDQAEWVRTNARAIRKPDYEKAILRLKDCLESLKQGLGPVWRNGELYFE